MLLAQALKLVRKMGLFRMFGPNRLALKLTNSNFNILNIISIEESLLRSCHTSNLSSTSLSAEHIVS